MKGGLSGLLKQAQTMKKKMEELQSELETLTVEAEAGEGSVRVKANARQRLLELRIDPAAAQDTGLLEDLLLTAVNRALDEGRRISDARMQAITGGVNLPFGA